MIQAILTANSHVGFDVCVNSGYLMEALSTVQQEGTNLRKACELQKLSLVMCDRPEGTPDAVLTLAGERMEVYENGAVFYHDATTECYECLEAPPA